MAISPRAEFASPLAAELADDVLERFLRYVRIDTQSKAGVAASPSTEKQLDLARLLRDELEEIGLDDVRLDEYGYVYGSLDGAESAPAIKIAQDAFETAFGVRPILTRSGGTLPIMPALADKGIPTILTGFALPESNVHSPNERMLVEFFPRGVDTIKELYTRLGDLS